uniref:Uncharacterized protein n=1 Tax=Cacopsylla melanoneura TaxID=428564 RepID=A0A8D8UCA4_9HEMI
MTSSHETETLSERPAPPTMPRRISMSGRQTLKKKQTHSLTVTVVARRLTLSLTDILTSLTTDKVKHRTSSTKLSPRRLWKILSQRGHRVCATRLMLWLRRHYPGQVLKTRMISFPPL